MLYLRTGRFACRHCQRLMSIIRACKDQREAALSEFLAGMSDRYPSLRGDPMLRR